MAREIQSHAIWRQMTQAEIRAVREQTGLSQVEFARVYRVNVATLRLWEQGIRHPTDAAEALLLAIGRDPVTMRELLE